MIVPVPEWSETDVWRARVARRYFAENTKVAVRAEAEQAQAASPYLLDERIKALSVLNWRPARG